MTLRDWPHNQTPCLTNVIRAINKAMTNLMTKPVTDPMVDSMTDPLINLITTPMSDPMTNPKIWMSGRSFALFWTSKFLWII